MTTRKTVTPVAEKAAGRHIRLQKTKKIRSANRHFFELSGIRKNRTEKQRPYIVMRPTQTRVNMDVALTAAELLELPDNTKVLAQWKGKSRSDFYQFTVRELRSHIRNNPPGEGQRI
jgi:type II secretory pathway component PulK